MGIGRAAGASGHVAVLVVDGLSFCTAVEVAVGQDASVLPFTFGGLARSAGRNHAAGRGFNADVNLAMQEGASTVVPLLRKSTFQHQLTRTTASPTATAPPDTTRAVMPPRPRTAL